MNTEVFFAERRNRADFGAFDEIMKLNGGETPKQCNVVGAS